LLPGFLSNDLYVLAGSSSEQSHRGEPLRPRAVPDQSLTAHCAEAIAAVDRSIASREERNRGIHAALGANRRVHFPLTAAESTAAAALLAPPGVPALRATLGFIGVTPGSVELLLPYRKGKVCVALSATESLV
jgi:hypothetical protein